MRAAHKLVEQGLAATQVLDYACCSPGQEAAVEFALRLGARGDEKSDEDSTPIHHAATKAAPRTVMMLLRGGAAVNAQTPETGMSVLWGSADHGALPIMKLLLAAHADVNAVKAKPAGNPPLHVASQNGHIECVMELIRAGACVNQRNSAGQQPVEFAICLGRVEVAALLLRHGARIQRGATDDKFTYSFDGHDGTPTVEMRALLKAAVAASDLAWMRRVIEPSQAASLLYDENETVDARGCDDAADAQVASDAAVLSAALMLSLVPGRSASMQCALAQAQLEMHSFQLESSQATSRTPDAILQEIDTALLERPLDPEIFLRLSFLRVRCLELQTDRQEDALAAVGVVLTWLQTQSPLLSAAHNSGIAHLLEHDASRLERALWGGPGSDSRVLLVARHHVPEDDVLPPPLKDYSTVVATNAHGVPCLYRFGGRTLSGWQNPSIAWMQGDSAQTWVFNTQIRQWHHMRTIGSRPAPRFEHSAVLWQGSMYVWGGELRRRAFAVPVADSTLYAQVLVQAEWSAISVSGTAPAARRGHRAVVLGDTMFVHGGELIIDLSPGGYLSSIASFDFRTANWSAIKAHGQMHPPGRQLHALWADAQSNRLLVFGGEGWPGGADGSNRTDGDGRGVYSLGDLWAFDLTSREWTSMRLLGDAPLPMQEATLLPICDGVVLCGGYHEATGLIKSDRQTRAEVKHSRLGDGGSPYYRTIYRYHTSTNFWRRMQILGDDGLPLFAQAWAVQTSDNTFIFGGGYGLTSETLEPARAATMGEIRASLLESASRQTGLPSLRLHCVLQNLPDKCEDSRSVFPCLLSSHYECRFHAVGEGKSSDCWGMVPHATFTGKEYGRMLRGSSREWVDARFLFGNSEELAQDIYGDKLTALCDEQKRACATSEAVFDLELSALVDPTFKDDCAPISELGRVEIHHMWFASTGGEKMNMNHDAYRGPISAEALKALEKGGWEESEGTSTRCVLSQPDRPGPLFRPPPLPKRQGPREALLELQKLQCERDVPTAQAYAKALSEVKVSMKASAALTLRVDVIGITPPIWRLVRVSPHMTLARLHDQVLCPVLGYTRNYHGYAFRRKAEPWLGPVAGTALDTAHLVFYMGALGDDRAVTVGSLLSAAGESITYVHDLGDWWSHRIEVVHGSSWQQHKKIDVAELLDGEGAGPPEDCGGPAYFVYQLNRLVGAACTEKHRDDRRPIIPGSDAYWKLLNDEFRKKNCSSVVYHPRQFDHTVLSSALATALRSRHLKPDAAHTRFPLFSMSSGVAIDADTEVRSGSREIRRVCAMCGVTACLVVCAGCNQRYYCGKACQRRHWKGGHKQDCKYVAFVGKRVVLHSLSGSTQLNGLAAAVEGFDANKRRLHVWIDEHRTVSVQLKNVALLTE